MQKVVEDFIKEYNLNCTEKIRYMDLVSEVGELGKEIIKSCNYGKQEFECTLEIKDEMGDCLFSLIALCYEMNINVNSALNSSIEKYKNRFSINGEIGSGK
jgi:uncharacterized protein YabN with tetrapyrrole methylase and pyrophosphatase domain